MTPSLAQPKPSSFTLHLSLNSILFNFRSVLCVSLNVLVPASSKLEAPSWPLISWQSVPPLERTQSLYKVCVQPEKPTSTSAQLLVCQAPTLNPMSVPREGSLSALVVVVLHVATRNKQYANSVKGTCIITDKDANTFLVTIHHFSFYSYATICTCCGSSLCMKKSTCSKQLITGYQD